MTAAELIAEARALNAVFDAERSWHLRGRLSDVNRDKEQALALLPLLADALEAALSQLRYSPYERPAVGR